MRKRLIILCNNHQIPDPVVMTPNPGSCTNDTNTNRYNIPFDISWSKSNDSVLSCNNNQIPDPVKMALIQIDTTFLLTFHGLKSMILSYDTQGYI